ncbi:hypothetical protein HPULCUR_002287 [Helicostylum pulchrum]|uniref:Uncharacterized protein n=1 Tax=Helicostylum pulchrum TaxID=562976 RepID=A0ABP9XQ34_9FUNG
MRLQIALTVVFFLLSIPVIIAAYKSSKEIGWEIYKKIGGSNHLKYLYHDVQRFALILKVDIFFQVFLLIGTTIISQKIEFVVISVALSILLAIGLMFARVAVSRESRWMMAVFLLLQAFLLACDVYCFIGLFQYPLTDIWYIGVVYVSGSIISITFTIYLTVQCQINFGKGLKPFIEWYPFQSQHKDKKEGHNPADSGLRTRRIDERMPIDDDDEDEEQDVGLLNKRDRFYGKNGEISRTSLERVDLVPYQIKVDRHQGLYKLDSIEFNSSSGFPVHKLEAQTLTRSSSLAISVSNESDLSVTTRPPPYSNIDNVISLPQSDRCDPIFETVINEDTAELFGKAIEVLGECIMFIAFEVWRIWLAFDGVLHSNSRTIWASASSSVFSLFLSILMIIESIKWIETDKILESNRFIPEWLEPLKYTNLYLLIGLSCILFFIIPATFYAAVKVAKDFGWDVYKKIGSSITIQEMYITVEWFSLALKIDIYFEFCAFTLFVIYLAAAYQFNVTLDAVFSTSLVMSILPIPCLVFSRYAISKESKIMMILFIIFQLESWYAFTGLYLASIIAAIGTIVLSIMCLLNFNKGLKEFVQWKPFSRNTNQKDTFQRLEDQRVDEPIDD